MKLCLPIQITLLGRYAIIYIIKIKQIKSTRYVPTTIRYSLFSNKGCFKQLSPPDRISLQAPPQTVPSCQASGPGLSGLPGHGRANFTRFLKGQKNDHHDDHDIILMENIDVLCFSKKCVLLGECYPTICIRKLSAPQVTCFKTPISIGVQGYNFPRLG